MTHPDLSARIVAAINEEMIERGDIGRAHLSPEDYAPIVERELAQGLGDVAKLNAIADTLTEYLSLSSIDGRAERQPLRAKMRNQLAALTPSRAANQEGPK